MTLSDIVGDHTELVGSVLTDLQIAKIDTADLVQMDHICYRVASTQDYVVKKEQLSTVATLLKETLVNGRPIATFRLHDPVLADGWRIDAVELPSPKPDNVYPEGLEHVEFVLFDDIPTFLNKYSGLPFDLKSADRGINPEIGLKLSKYSVKFHLLNLPTVVYLEDKLAIKAV